MLFDRLASVLKDEQDSATNTHTPELGSAFQRRGRTLVGLPTSRISAPPKLGGRRYHLGVFLKGVERRGAHWQDTLTYRSRPFCPQRGRKGLGMRVSKNLI